MEQQNPNNQNNQNSHNTQGNQQNHPPKTNSYNSRPQPDRNRTNNQERRPFQDKNAGSDRFRGDRNKIGDKSIQDKAKNQNDLKYNQKPREQKSNDRAKPEYPVKAQQSAHAANTGSNNNTANSQNRFSKNITNNSGHMDSVVKNIKPKRIETVEDIQADIERIDKDIQFEIKQIKAVKLGL